MRKKNIKKLVGWKRCMVLTNSVKARPQESTVELESQARTLCKHSVKEGGPDWPRCLLPPAQPQEQATVDDSHAELGIKPH